MFVQVSFEGVQVWYCNMVIVELDQFVLFQGFQYVVYVLMGYVYYVGDVFVGQFEGYWVGVVLGGVYVCQEQQLLVYVFGYVVQGVVFDDGDC